MPLIDLSKEEVAIILAYRLAKNPTGYGKLLVTVVAGKVNQIEPTPLYKASDFALLTGDKM